MTRSDINIDEVQAKAKSIMDSFYNALASIPTEEIPKIQRKESIRSPKPTQQEFKHKFLANAPKKDRDYVLAEKKTW